MGGAFNGLMPRPIFSRMKKMAGNTRGKLKEHFEGIHRNFDWILYHCEKSLILIKAQNPGLAKAIDAIAASVAAVDKMVQDLYSRL